MKSVSRSKTFGWLAAAALSALAFSLPASAQPVEGRDYTRLETPQTPETTGKIEVIEFFSYGCPHCFDFNPLVSNWAAKLPKNVVFIRVPVAFGRAEWGALARTYYTLQATGDLERLDNALFDAIHKERKPLFNEENLAQWAADNGVDRAKFTAAYNSFSVTTKAKHAEQMSRSYKVDGVPKLVIDGKYVPLGNTFQAMLANAEQVLDDVVEPARSAKASK
ncbi:MAG TPA: thiol:disulfide interchange protein DsbA/DsbL [Povalibacter sp.]|nr:thiol:disulfide interchange protein DsbA/DsbL [Povalibacter sp.]